MTTSNIKDAIASRRIDTMKRRTAEALRKKCGCPACTGAGLLDLLKNITGHQAAPAADLTKAH